jgi:predicted O-methyltransferase YrrM
MGTAYSKISNFFKDNEQYISFREEHISRDFFQNYIEENWSSFNILNKDQANLSARFPINEENFIDKILLELYNNNIIQSVKYPKENFLKYRKKVYESFNHEDNITYIFPEEERIMYALFYILKPKKSVFMGSYYGYWAVWCLPHLLENSEIYLLDVDRKVLDLSKENFLKLHNNINNIYFINEDAIDFVTKIDSIDYAILDAEGPKDYGPIELRDKRIYSPMMKSLYRGLSKKSVVIAHNILLENFSNGKYFDRKIESNLEQFQDLYNFISENFKMNLNFNTTEGIGIYNK